MSLPSACRFHQDTSSSATIPKKGEKLFGEMGPSSSTKDLVKNVQERRELKIKKGFEK